ncbi:MAG: class I SAM-dependent methyltransferase [Gammaproteobacteria bacterium]|nr:class I SAM-dependent methyltransferase [Gammaproteobacteria bacterium]
MPEIRKLDKEAQFSTMTNWKFMCPACRAAELDLLRSDTVCSDCGFRSTLAAGVWPLMTDGDRARYESFVDTYTSVRIKEGRDQYDQAVLRSLPECDAALPMAKQWRIRARSFRVLRKTLRDRLQPKAKIADLGAGTGWLSNRLRESGYSPCSIDVSADLTDGLGAARQFTGVWPRLQATFDNLPLADGSIDAVIFNASFHYCTNPAATIKESSRVLRPGGLLIILDSPIYEDASSGEKMLEEQQEYFTQLIGRRSEAIQSAGFLTWAGLDALAGQFGLEWNCRFPWYGMRWALRPLYAKLTGGREPATFAIVLTTTT